jgi:alpha-beta hydrolase superfamily lysophospholipase
MEDNEAAPTYDEMVERTRPAASRPQDDFPIVVSRAYGRKDTPHLAAVFTARTWWHSRSPAATHSRPVRWIERVQAPILLVQGDQDAIVDPGDLHVLTEAGRAADRDVWAEMIPGAGHSFHGQEEEVIAVVADWLDGIA